MLTHMYIPKKVAAGGGAGIALVNSANVLADSTFDSADNTIDSSTYTPASNDNVLVIVVGMGDGEGITPTVSWGASTLTAEASDFSTSLNYVDTAAIYVVTSPGTTAQDVTVAKASGGRNWITVDIMEFSGVNTTTPVVQSSITAGALAGAPTTSHSITLTGTVSGNMVAGGVLLEGDGATVAATDDATLAHASASTGTTSTSDGASAALYAASSGGSVTIGASSSNQNDMIAVAVELAAA